MGPVQLFRYSNRYGDVIHISINHVVSTMRRTEDGVTSTTLQMASGENLVIEGDADSDRLEKLLGSFLS